MIDPITAAAAATKAYAGVKAFIEAGKSMKTFPWWRVGKQAPQTFCTLVSVRKNAQILKQWFCSSVEAEAAQMFAAKRIENQRKEIVTLLQYAYGNEGFEEYRRCMKRFRSKGRGGFAQQEAKDALIKSFWIVVLVGIAEAS